MSLGKESTTIGASPSNLWGSVVDSGSGGVRIDRQLIELLKLLFHQTLPRATIVLLLLPPEKTTV